MLSNLPFPFLHFNASAQLWAAVVKVLLCWYFHETRTLFTFSRMMYWSYHGTLARIEKASMDGANRAVIHSSNLMRPLALTLDTSTQTLYWADGSLSKIETSGVDGSNRRVIIQLTGTNDIFGIAIGNNNNIYFSDLNTIRTVGGGNTTATVYRRRTIDTCEQLAAIKIVNQFKHIPGS